MKIEDKKKILNNEAGYTRGKISVRFIMEKAVFDPRAGQGASFTKQLTLEIEDHFK